MTKKTKPSKVSANVPVTKQTAGAVTGAVVGSMIAGPAGAIVGGITGAFMGNRVQEGKSAIPAEAVTAAKAAAKRVQSTTGAKSVTRIAKKAVSGVKSSAKSTLKLVKPALKAKATTPRRSPSKRKK